jgi:putative transposase
MVRAGVVKHPSEWPFGGYNEIQEPKRKNVLIRYDRLRELVGIETYDLMQAAHKKWVESYLTGGIKRREECWTRSIAVGSDGFINKVKSIMGVSAIGRNCVPAGDSYQLREPRVSYNADFGVKNGNIEPENTFEWR